MKGNVSPISEGFYKKYDGKQPDWGFNGLGYVTYKRTYARTKEDGNTEEWCETVRRCTEWLFDVHKEMHIDLPNTYYQKLYDIVFNLKANFSGRMLWQAGTQTVDNLGGASLCNCWAVVADSKESFLSVFDYLMLGGGVGYNIQERHVSRLPQIKEGVQISHTSDNGAEFIVPDSREGWVQLLDKILTSFFESGDSFKYNTNLIRPYGQPISGFGGTASGPEPLIKGMTKIIDLVKTREGKQLRPIDVLDMMNCLGELVVAGNVRRSAQIALGDIHDKDFMLAKDWSSGAIPNHRAMSNNSVIVNDIADLNENFWKGYTIDEETGAANGEPYGLMNLTLARHVGRLVDPDRKDPDVIATNPCAEISLSPSLNDGGAESCNLCEIYLNNLDDAEEFEEVAKIMYHVVKTIAMLPYHRSNTEKIVHANLRLGMGLTGIVQRPDLVKEKVLDKVYKSIDALDKSFSKRNNVPTSIKLTTVKPSGTLSLLGGATPGIHPAYSRRYIRRIRMASHDKLVELCKDAGYKVEFVQNFDGTDDKRTVVVEFPVELERNVGTAAKMSATELLDLVKHLQTWWADNQVSCTVYYKPDEMDAIRSWLQEHYNDGVKTLSFLLHQEHGFAQAPYEEIDKKTYDELIVDIKPLDFSQKIEEATLEDSLECAKGSCPIR